MSTFQPVLQEMPTSVGAQRVSSASQEPLYTLIHDLRQPLSAIESIAYCLELMVPAEEAQARLYISRLHQLISEASFTLANAARSA